jgi:hypothetical protein
VSAENGFQEEGDGLAARMRNSVSSHSFNSRVRRQRTAYLSDRVHDDAIYETRGDISVTDETKKESLRQIRTAVLSLFQPPLHRLEDRIECRSTEG